MRPYTSMQSICLFLKKRQGKIGSGSFLLVVTYQDHVTKPIHMNGHITKSSRTCLSAKEVPSAASWSAVARSRHAPNKSRAPSISILRSSFRDKPLKWAISDFADGSLNSLRGRQIMRSASDTVPTGQLMRKTHLHVVLSLIAPPIKGPTANAIVKTNVTIAVYSGHLMGGTSSKNIKVPIE